MTAVDTNILIYLLVSSQPEHPRAKAWLAANDEPLATTQTNIAEVLRLLTHPRVFARPMALPDAVHLLSDFINSYTVTVLADQENWWLQLPSLMQAHPGLRGNEIFDARIALCLRHHGIRTLCTLDADFAKYPFLKPISP